MNARAARTLLGVLVLVLLIPPSSADAIPTAALVEAEAVDTPDDGGGSITVRWPGIPGAHVVRLSRREFGGRDSLIVVTESAAEEGEYQDNEVVDGVAYEYRLEALLRFPPGPGGAMEELTTGVVSLGPVSSSGQWFHTGRLNILIAVIVLTSLIMFYIERARRGASIFVRRIAGLEAVDEAVGRATEMGRQILFLPGTQDMDNVQTLAGLAILGRVGRLSAQYDARLEVPVSRSLVMVAARETVKEAYLSEGRPDGHREEMVYYLTDDQFGYAAALEGMMAREAPAAVFMLGCFYAESLLLAENGNAAGAIQIAGTAEASQLPFFVAACDYTLIGEELFVAGAYLSKEPRQLGSLKGQDMGKAIILLLLVVGIILQTSGVVDAASWFTVR